VLKCREGLFVFSGVGSSGRTTTLYSLASALSSAGRKVISVEETVHRQMKGFTQAQANPLAGCPLAMVMRHALRQDADVLIVDGIIEVDALKTALRGAAGGRLVLASF